MRSDAERNRAKVLAAARELLAGPVEDLSMAEVARTAGVGMATLYRNYPGRRELLEALYSDEVDAVCAAAVPDPENPAGALRTWLVRLAAFFTTKHRVAVELLKHTDAGDPVFGGGRDRVFAAGRPLLVAAQDAGVARGGLDVAQVVDLVIAVVTVRRDPGYVEPLLETVLDGLLSAGGN